MLKICCLMENLGKVVVAESQTQQPKCLVLNITRHRLVAKQQSREVIDCRESECIGQENGSDMKMFEKNTRSCSFTPPWNGCITKGCIQEGEERVSHPRPLNAHPTSLTTVDDFIDEAAKRGKAKAKRDAKEAKAKQVKAKNVELTQQDVLKKKECASPSKASHLK